MSPSQWLLKKKILVAFASFLPITLMVYHLWFINHYHYVRQDMQFVNSFFEYEGCGLYSNKQQDIALSFGVTSSSFLVRTLGSHTFIQNYLLHPISLDIRRDAALEKLSFHLDLSALKRLDVSGNSIIYSWKDEPPKPVTNTFSGRSMALLKDCRKIESFNAAGSLLEDDAMRIVGNWSRLEELDLSNTKVTDDGLRFLQRYPRLHTLNLAGLPVTDALMQSLIKEDQYPTLTRLYFADSQITSDSLKVLGYLPELVELSLGGADLTQATSDDWKPLAKHRELYALGLADAKINEQTIRSLTPLRSLQELNLTGTDITPDILRALKRLPRIRSIIFEETEINNTHIDLLAELTHLRELSVHHTRINREHVLKLRERLPRCEIRY
ncbi:Leucine Rich repeats (2 copies) [Polystyrenella longa]|uniref:Leucine Rich repeats (2 copies) n=1 Tax=Polystyrenella longa TaxID=2528007 RepID=A0A518CH51_9PLAN|nr:hypothetical protein [Polystyrenella longa]QDU78559.1 Leucine Rich repeats (2 copies) [Polystyrenella longa]